MRISEREKLRLPKENKSGNNTLDEGMYVVIDKIGGRI